MLYLLPHVRDYYGNVVTVHHNAVASFVNAGVDFLLLLVGHDVISTKMEAYLNSFLGSHKLGLVVLRVDVDADPTTAVQLAVVVVPQLRLFYGGVEVTRYRGFVGYDKLLSLFVS